MYGLRPVPFNDGCAVDSMEMSTEYEVILLTSEGTKVRCKATIWDRQDRSSHADSLASEGIFLSAHKRIWRIKNVPQRLKPSIAGTFVARVNPCPSRTGFSNDRVPRLSTSSPHILLIPPFAESAKDGAPDHLVKIGHYLCSHQSPPRMHSE